MPYPGDTIFPGPDTFPGVGDSGPVILSGFAQALYDELAPLHYGEPDNDYALARFCSAVAVPYDAIWELVVTPDVPWSPVLNLPDTPIDFLDWLGRFKGVTPIAGLVVAARRLRITQAAGFERGRPQGIIDRVKERLEGTQTVTLDERYEDSPWRIRVSVNGSEVIGSEDKLEAAIAAAKPAGIVLTLNIVGGFDFQALRDSHTDFQDVRDTFADFEDARNDPSRT